MRDAADHHLMRLLLLLIARVIFIFIAQQFLHRFRQPQLFFRHDIRFVEFAGHVCPFQFRGVPRVRREHETELPNQKIFQLRLQILQRQPDFQTAEILALVLNRQQIAIADKTAFAFEAGDDFSVLRRGDDGKAAFRRIVAAQHRDVHFQKRRAVRQIEIEQRHLLLRLIRGIRRAQAIIERGAQQRLPG